MRCRKRFQDFFPEPVKEFVIGQARGELSFFVIEKEKIYIRAVIQLATSEFAERENGKFRIGRTVALSEFPIPMFEHTTDANFRDLRKLTGGFLKRRYVRQFTKRDSRHLAAFPKAKKRKVFGGDRITCESKEIVEHFSITARRQTHLGPTKPENDFRVPDQSRRANIRDSEEMKEGSFAEWKFFDNIDECWLAYGPFF